MLWLKACPHGPSRGWCCRKASRSGWSSATVRWRRCPGGTRSPVWSTLTAASARGGVRPIDRVYDGETVRAVVQARACSSVTDLVLDHHGDLRRRGATEPDAHTLARTTTAHAKAVAKLTRGVLKSSARTTAPADLSPTSERPGSPSRSQTPPTCAKSAHHYLPATGLLPGRLTTYKTMSDTTRLWSDGLAPSLAFQTFSERDAPRTPLTSSWSRRTPTPWLAGATLVLKAV